MAVIAPPKPFLSFWPDEDSGAVLLTLYPDTYESDGDAYAHFQWSIDGETWHDVRRGTLVPVEELTFGSFTSEQAELRDYDRVPQSYVYYRARLIQTDGVTTEYSPWNDADDPIPTVVQAGSVDWWLKDPRIPSQNVRLELTWSDIDRERPKAQGVFRSIGKTTPRVRSGKLQSNILKFSVQFDSSQREEALEDLYEGNRTLLLQDPAGRQWFVQLLGGFHPVEEMSVGRMEGRRSTVEIQAVEVDPV